MPRFNSDGQWCAGIGKGIVSKGTGPESMDIVHIATDAGDAQWLGDRVIYQRETAALGAFIEAEGGDILSPFGANRLRAGGPLWAAWLAGAGYRDSLGRVNAAWSVAGVGPDGTVCVTIRETGVGLWLLAPDGA